LLQKRDLLEIGSNDGFGGGLAGFGDGAEAQEAEGLGCVLLGFVAVD